MIIYKTCTDVPISVIFEAFSLGFSDYIIPLTMSQDAFEARFFGPEGNALSLSFIALDQSRPIGLILGGIRVFDGLKTMRCGTLCISPDYRGQGISQRLFEMHKSAALTSRCKQLFLEVIKNNYRAVKFYENCHYKHVYTLKYYSSIIQAISSSADTLVYTMKQVSFDNLETFRKSLTDCHINWQSDTPCYAFSRDEVLLGAYEGDGQVALIAMSPQGKINFLWVHPTYRNQGLGRSMIQKATQAQNVEKVTICLPNNSSLEGFLRKLRFQKDPIEQHEMYLPL